MSASSRPATEPPASFHFTPENYARAQAIIARYPEGRQASAVLPLLDLAQRQCGNWLPRAALEYVAQFLGLPFLRVHEVASFYTMFNLQPVGENLVQICRTTPCWLKGSESVTNICRARLGIGPGETTPDGKFTLKEVECLGACVNAPVVQINDDYYEDLTPLRFEKILEDLAAGRKPEPGKPAGGGCGASGGCGCRGGDSAPPPANREGA